MAVVGLLICLILIFYCNLCGINFDVDWNMGVCLYGFEFVKSFVVVFFIVGIFRVFFICFGVYYWFVFGYFL